MLQELGMLYLPDTPRGWLIGAAVCVGTLAVLPVTHVIYIRYRLWRAGGRVMKTKAYSWYSQLCAPFIVYRGMGIDLQGFDTILSLAPFRVRPDDVIVAGFPRSGTTWLQQLVYLVIHDADTAKATSERLDVRVPYLEHGTDLTAFGRRPSPRVYKTHLHYHLLPAETETKQPKIIYVLRNPKDVSVSYYNLFRTFLVPLNDNFDHFIDSFIEGKVLFGPWLNHVNGFWERRHQENILFMKYEHMQKDIHGIVRLLASFLGRTLTDEQYDAIVRHTSFNNMKQNDKVNFTWFDACGFTKNLGDSFIRKGKVGDWKNHLCGDQSARMDKMVADGLRGTGLSTEYEIDP